MGVPDPIEKCIEALEQGILHERELRERWEQNHIETHRNELRERILAASEINRRLDEMNQLRAQIENERGRYVVTEVYTKAQENLRDQLYALDRRMDDRLKLLENLSANVQGRLWMMGATISAVVIIVNVAMRMWTR